LPATAAESAAMLRWSPAALGRSATSEAVAVPAVAAVVALPARPNVAHLLVRKLDGEDEADRLADDQTVFRHKGDAARPRADDVALAEQIDTRRGTLAAHRHGQAAADGDADLPSGQ